MSERGYEGRIENKWTPEKVQSASTFVELYDSVNEINRDEVKDS
jgi:hypothetical protein